MTLTPGNTPPPAPRNQLSSPPPPPRKPRRGVRKRRRPPRETRSPVCVVCKKKRQLRHNGLCWSLECALRAVDHRDDDEGTDVHGRDHNNPDKLAQPQFLDLQGEDNSVREQHHEFVSALSNFNPQLSGRDDNILRDAEDHVDRRSLEEEIQKQEKDVDRGEPSERQHGMEHVGSDNSAGTDETEDNNNEAIGT